MKSKKGFEIAFMAKLILALILLLVLLTFLTLKFKPSIFESLISLDLW